MKSPKQKPINTYKPFFINPKKIGEVANINDEKYILTHIQGFEIDIFRKQLMVQYIGQELNNDNYNSFKSIDNEHYVVTDVEKHFSHKGLSESLKIGSLHFPNGYAWRITDILNIEWNEEKIKIKVKLKRIQPIEQSEAKKIRRDIKKNNFKLI